MRVFVWILLLDLLVTGKAHAQRSPDTPADSAEYWTLVHQLQSGDTLIDFTALRFLFANQPGPQDVPDARAILQAAEQAPEDSIARRMVDSLLVDYYGAIYAHMDAAHVFQVRGDSARARFHEATVRGFIRSMEAGAKTRADSAIPVVSIAEEYAYLRARGLEPTMQGVGECGEYYCDTLSAKDPSTGQEYEFTFVLTWWKRE